MKEFQITVVVMTTLMAFSLVVLLPKQVSRNPVANRSRWLMAGGLALVGLQFLIQYIGGYRFTDILKAVIINIAFFIPCSAMLGLSVLNLQRQGRLKPIEKWISVPTWLLAMALMITPSLIQKQPFAAYPANMIWAEIGASTLYGLMQLYYSYLQFKEVNRMREVLNDYYDSSQDDLLTWMKINVLFIAWMAIFVPIMIFTDMGVLMGFGALLFVGLFYQWCYFCRFIISGEAKTISKAEEGAVEELKETQELISKTMLSDEIKLRVEKAVTLWVNNEGYLRKGITSPDAAKEMKLRRYQLASWIKEAGYSSFSNWITTLRVNYAKELLAAHHEWSNETIADHCGISLSHFQKVFHEQTGMTPAQYLQSPK